MSPSPVFCPYLDCAHKGLTDTETISVHAYKSREERTPTRYHCAACNRTFSARRCTPFYRLHHPEALMVVVLTLRAHGCPIPAVVLALGLDERTVRTWLLKAGVHAAVFHDHRLAEAGGVEAAHVQADEICVRVRGGRMWLAQAIEVGSRFWLGGVVARRRDGLRVRHLLTRVKAAVVAPTFLLLVDGFAPYVSAARALFRVPRRTGRVGRPPLGWPEGFLRGQVVKAGRRTGGGIVRRAVVGTEAALVARLTATRSGLTLHTAYSERLNATTRERLAVLVRRTRSPARRLTTLEAGMWRVGCCSNGCDAHAALRLRQVGCAHKWRERTPAMAAGLTDRIWTVGEVLGYRVPPIPLTAPQAPRRGRPSSKGKVIALPGRPDGRSGPPGRQAA